MRCANCESEVTKGAKFCPSCGSSLENQSNTKPSKMNKKLYLHTSSW